MDRDFADEEAKYKTYVSLADMAVLVEIVTDHHSFEKECQALQREGKAYWDAVRGPRSNYSTLTLSQILCICQQ